MCIVSYRINGLWVAVQTGQATKHHPALITALSRASRDRAVTGCPELRNATRQRTEVSWIRERGKLTQSLRQTVMEWRLENQPAERQGKVRDPACIARLQRLEFTGYRSAEDWTPANHLSTMRDVVFVFQSTKKTVSRLRTVFSNPVFNVTTNSIK